MPTYTYVCEDKKCRERFDAFKKSMISNVAIGEVDHDVVCEHCGKQGGKRVWPDELDITIAFGEFRDRQDKKDDDHTKRVKDPERADHSRKHAFGGENVRTPRSEIAKQNHKIRKRTVPASDSKAGEVDKTDFIKTAARNPRAVAAAQAALRRAGRK